MTPTVESAIAELKTAFPEAAVTATEDGAGGASVIVEPVTLGPKFAPMKSWLGGHIAAQTPYADVYPLFLGADVVRADGSAWSDPVRPGHRFLDRPALQISRRSNRLDPSVQTATHKFQKVLHWLQTQN